MSEVDGGGYELVFRRTSAGTYSCRFLELPGSNFICEDEENILLESKKVLNSWLTHATNEKIFIPKPGAHSAVNGTIRVKVGRTLHRRISFLSEEHNIAITSLTAVILQCGANWLLHELKVIDGPADMSLKVGPHRGWSGRQTVEESWTQKVSCELHYTLAWLAENEKLSISALTQLLIGKVMWTMSTT